MTYEVNIEKLAGKGKSLARHDGKVIFIPFGVPGDKVNIETYKQTKSYDEAHITNVITESPLRIKTPCRYFGTCGGCDHQNIDYNQLLNFKKELLSEVYRNYTNDKISIEKIHSSPKTYGYRNKIHLHGFQNSKFQAWGFYHYQNRKIVNIDACAIAQPLANKMFQEILRFLKQRFFKFFLMLNEIVIQVNTDNSAAMVTLVSNHNLDAPKSLFEKMKTAIPELCALFLYHCKNKKGYTFKTSIDDSLDSVHGLKQIGGGLLSVDLANLKLELSPLSFFQVNSDIAENVIE